MTLSTDKTTNLCFTRNNHSINVTNIQNGEEICFSLMLLQGNVATENKNICSCQCATVCVSSADDPVTAAQTTFWPIHNSKFKCLLNLTLGSNTFILRCCTAELYYNVKFRPKSTSLSVTPVYIICEGHDGRFQAPECEDDSIESACERIGVGMQLIQTLIAEKLHESGYGHKTFQLSHDLKSDAPECNVFYSKLPVEKAFAMTSLELWEYFGRELMKSNLASKSTKYVAFISCTRYICRPSDKLPSTHDEIISLTNGHTALGGGGLALFGSACLHTWPCTVEEVVPRFLCTTKVDRSLFMDDSYYSGTYGACFSTTLGSVCHELGHTFDLGHTKNGIMGRDYNNFHCVFTLNETTHKDVSATQQAQLLPQHSTVLFSQNLIPTFKYNILESSTSKLCGSSMRNDGETVTLINKKIIKSTTEECPKPPPLKCHKNYLRDETFWSESCSAILANHRWLNPSHPDELTSLPAYLKDSKTVSSASGIRVIELRHCDGTVYESWVFTGNHVHQHFSIPSDLKLTTGSYIIALDSMGAILKETVE